MQGLWSQWEKSCVFTGFLPYPALGCHHSPKSKTLSKDKKKLSMGKQKKTPMPYLKSRKSKQTLKTQMPGQCRSRHAMVRDWTATLSLPLGRSFLIAEYAGLRSIFTDYSFLITETQGCNAVNCIILAQFTEIHRTLYILILAQNKYKLTSLALQQ